ncbi:hypothetical protein GCM10010151_26800 [Actinoallomurus spadix]|uniref:Transposase n=1 Tax=Actinoallomurus spadix TaxID=79912 RepID=A0ABN0WFF0_9ACTN
MRLQEWPAVILYIKSSKMLNVGEFVVDAQRVKKSSGIAFGCFEAILKIRDVGFDAFIRRACIPKAPAILI